MTTVQIQFNQSHLEPILKMGGDLEMQLNEIDWQELETAISECITNEKSCGLPENYSPASYFPLHPEDAETKDLYRKAESFGKQIIADGKVAAFTVAGGQGTRLGYDGPKGTLPVSPVKKKSLFQIFAEQILGVNRKFNTNVPWYIMCSPLNHDATIQFFEKNRFFGLEKNNVKFFTQGVMPATDFEGKLLAASKDSLAMSPNGHGGSLKALIDSGSIADMKERGIEHISYFQVDNPLVTIANPLFIGLHTLKRSDMSSRSLTKTGPLEKLGNFVMSGGKLSIIEYSDLPEKRAQETDDKGHLKYRAGSPAIHIMRRDFIEKFADASLKLPFHRAEKKVPHINCNGELITPDKPNAVKFETFVFDALPLAKNPVILEADRSEEFSPVKNKAGVDSIESSQADQVRKAALWLSRIGAIVEQGAIVEISPKYCTPGDIRNLGHFSAGESYYIS